MPRALLAREAHRRECRDTARNQSSSRACADIRYGVHRRTLDHGARISQAAGRAGLTLNTLVQGAWAYVLHRYSGRDDMLFGVTVAGRPAELPGVEEMVGVFINTLPFRTRIAARDRHVREWLHTLQTQQAAIDAFAATPLVDIQGWSALPRGLPLFETVLVFENYPAAALRQAPWALGSCACTSERIIRSQS